MKVVTFAGGVGGAKLVDGLARCLKPSDLTVIVNTGDDFDFLGLRICPDLDTICYTLAGVANSKTGWGRGEESWNALQTLERLGAPTWFRVGDKDLGYHIERTNRLRSGVRLSAIVRHFCQMHDVEVNVLPMSDDNVSTYVHSKDGNVYPFQEYFVHQRCEPEVIRFEFAGVEVSEPTPGAITAILEADCIVICPSNPWVSIDPILAVPGIRAALFEKRVVAVSPLIQGKAVKGPAAKMYAELGILPSSAEVSRHYLGLITAIMIDHKDENEVERIKRQGIIPIVTNVFMEDIEDRTRLAFEVIRFCESHMEGKIT